MKKIYILLLLSALAFQSTVAQNEQPNPYQVAKEDGYGYRSLIKLLDMDSTFIGSKFEQSNCSIWTAPLSARSLNIPITTC